MRTTTRLALALVLACASAKPANVLLIIVDDLRVDLGLAYGRTESSTPNLDAFTAQPTTLVLNAYVQIPICCPSRTSLLLGRSPDVTGAFTNEQQMRQLPGGKTWVSLPQLFKNNGYLAFGGGKVYQLGHDDAASWSAGGYFYANRNQDRECLDDLKAHNILGPNGKPVLQAGVMCSTEDMGAILDHQLVVAAKAELAKLASRSEPFFMAVGFFKPHVPWHVHKMFWSLFRTISDAVYLTSPLPQNQVSYDPEIVAMDYHIPSWTTPWGPPLDYVTRQAIRTAYGTFCSLARFARMRTWRQHVGDWGGTAAAVAQTDFFVGDLLGELDALALHDSTLVVVLGDNGYNTGENGLWGKDTLFDTATAVPWLMRVPWLQRTPGARNPMPLRFTGLVETLDVYRTVAALLNLTSKVDPTVEGRDLSTLVKTMIVQGVASSESAALLNASFSQVVRCPVQLDCYGAPVTRFSVKGYSVRTAQWRFATYLPVDTTLHVADWSAAPVLEELFVHNAASELVVADTAVAYEGENTNVIASFSDVAAVLRGMVYQRFASMVPPPPAAAKRP